jgi:hypothetical protein
MGGASTSAPEPAAFLRVYVREPERFEGKNALGMRATYWSYLVRTESTISGMRTDGTEVRRRFSDFEALHKLLKSHYRGYIIPPLPEKAFLEARLGSEEFLRLRRADLQVLLRARSSLCAPQPTRQHPQCRRVCRKGSTTYPCLGPYRRAADGSCQSTMMLVRRPFCAAWRRTRHCASRRNSSTSCCCQVTGEAANIGSGSTSWRAAARTPMLRSGLTRRALSWPCRRDPVQPGVDRGYALDRQQR